MAQGYHLLAAALFAPALVLQPALLALALGVALALMVAAEVVRLGAVPVVSASPMKKPILWRFRTFVANRRFNQTCRRPRGWQPWPCFKVAFKDGHRA